MTKEEIKIDELKRKIVAELQDYYEDGHFKDDFDTNAAKEFARQIVDDLTDILRQTL